MFSSEEESSKSTIKICNVFYEVVNNEYSEDLEMQEKLSDKCFYQINLFRLFYSNIIVYNEQQYNKFEFILKLI